MKITEDLLINTTDDIRFASRRAQRDVIRLHQYRRPARRIERGTYGGFWTPTGRFGSSLGPVCCEHIVSWTQVQGLFRTLVSGRLILDAAIASRRQDHFIAAPPTSRSSATATDSG
jgi:hypothetical protein